MALATLGCKVNQYESAGILEALDASIFTVVPFNVKADCYIINTCTVTGRTDYQSRQLIRRAMRLNPNASIIVTGCYAQIAFAEIARMPGVTLVTGTAEKEKIPYLLKNMGKDHTQIFVGNAGEVREFSGLAPKVFPGRTRAFLKIQDGCNSRCSYCIVPHARGRSRSLPEEEAIRRIEILAQAHYREVVLTGIHLGIYGQDLIPPLNLITLLKHIDTRKSVERLRLSSIEITEISDDMLLLMAKSPVFCRHLHIPLQSGDDRILKAMNRNYDTDFFRSRLDGIVRTVPGVSIGIDVMAGFPEESEEAFHNTLDLIEDLPAAYLHVFPYSDRPGTVASSLPGKVEEKEKKRRVNTLRTVGQRKRNAFAERFKGQKLSVLVEDKDRSTRFIRGYSDNYIPVLITDGDMTLSHRVVEVVPYAVSDGKLLGRIMNHDG